MLIFMTRKKLEAYIKRCCYNTMKQTGLSDWNETQDELRKRLDEVMAMVEAEITAWKKNVANVLDETTSQAEVERMVKEKMGVLQQEITSKINAIQQLQSGREFLGHEEILSIIEETIAKQQAEMASQQDWHQEMQAYVDARFNKIVDPYFERLRREFVNATQEQYRELQVALEQEKRAKEKLEEHIRKQDQSIKDLIAYIASMNKQQEENPVCDESTLKEEPTIVFTEDMEQNGAILQNLYDQTKQVREQISQEMSGEDQLESYLKIADKCINKLEMLKQKNSLGKTEADRLARECIKIYKSSIVKLLGISTLHSVMEDYMRSCHFKKLDWKVGKKLDDKEYEYLEDPIFYEDVEDNSKNDTILKIMQDTYVMAYREDGQTYEAVIPGIYSIGKYKM